MKNYYVLSNGRVRREANTLYVETADGVKKPLPVEDVDSLYLYGEVDLNTRYSVPRNSDRYIRWLIEPKAS